VWLDNHIPRPFSTLRFIKNLEFNRPYDYSNDIALLQLDSPVEFNEKLSPLCIPDEDVCFKEGIFQRLGISPLAGINIMII
jgi:hypothetical protein